MTMLMMDIVRKKFITAEVMYMLMELVTILITLTLLIPMLSGRHVLNMLKRLVLEAEPTNWFVYNIKKAGGREVYSRPLFDVLFST